MAVKEKAKTEDNLAKVRQVAFKEKVEANVKKVVEAERKNEEKVVV